MEYAILQAYRPPFGTIWGLIIAASAYNPYGLKARQLQLVRFLSLLPPEVVQSAPAILE